jgi:hypothetical protein
MNACESKIQKMPPTSCLKQPRKPLEQRSSNKEPPSSAEIATEQQTTCMPSLSLDDDSSSSASSSSHCIGAAFYGHLVSLKSGVVSSASPSPSSSTRTVSTRRTASSSSLSSSLSSLPSPTTEKKKQKNLKQKKQQRKRVVRINEKLNLSYENKSMTREQCCENWYTPADYRRFRFVRGLREFGMLFAMPWKDNNNQQAE